MLLSRWVAACCTSCSIQVISTHAKSIATIWLSYKGMDNFGKSKRNIAGCWGKTFLDTNATWDSWSIQGTKDTAKLGTFWIRDWQTALFMEVGTTPTLLKRVSVFWIRLWLVYSHSSPNQGRALRKAKTLHHLGLIKARELHVIRVLRTAQPTSSHCLLSSLKYAKSDRTEPFRTHKSLRTHGSIIQHHHLWPLGQERVGTS